MSIEQQALLAHAKWRGKIEIVSRAAVQTREDLSLCYTPGVAAPCLEIVKDPAKAYEYTRRGNLVAVITDGSAVLGLGNIGGCAGMPVMEGKCCLFKEFAGVDAFPVCIRSNDVDEIVRTIELISDSFGGINLEDISAPRCFEIEEKLKQRLDIPVFHDDQHGTAVVVAAALINSLKLAEKNAADVTVVINGAGAAGIAIGGLLLKLGVGDIILCDKDGIIVRTQSYTNGAHEKMKNLTNRNGRTGLLADAVRGADVFVGVSRPRTLTAEMIRTMADKPIVFAMANPEPEIMPDTAKAAGAFIVGTGRSDFPNQINNVLVFPGIFRGALDCGAKAITEEMKLAAARAVADAAGTDGSGGGITTEHILPSALDRRVAAAVAAAVREVYAVTSFTE